MLLHDISVLMLLNVVRAIILLLISFSHLPSSVIKLPRYILCRMLLVQSVDMFKNRIGRTSLIVHLWWCLDVNLVECFTCEYGPPSLSVSHSPCKAVRHLTTMFFVYGFLSSSHNLSSAIRLPAGSPPTVHRLTSSIHTVLRLPGKHFPSNFSLCHLHNQPFPFLLFQFPSLANFCVVLDYWYSVQSDKTNTHYMKGFYCMTEAVSM